jgi:hypothetical protein
MEVERWRKEEERWIPKFRVEEYVYNSMYDLTNHGPALHLKRGKKCLYCSTAYLSRCPAANTND